MLRRRRPTIAAVYNLPDDGEAATREDIAEYNAIGEAARRAGYDVRAVNISNRLDRLERALRHPRPDAVLNLVESFSGDARLEFAVASLYELHGIAYTGSPPSALMTCQRKGFTKHLMRSAGIVSPRYRILFEPELPVRHGLRYPVIVKPAREDGSLGVDEGSVVRRHRDALERVRKLFREYRPPILVEEYIEGRELHVAILGNRRRRVLPLLEYDFARLAEGRAHIMTHEAKWNPSKRRGPRQVCPAPLAPEIAHRVHEAALAVYELTGCRDYARLDTRIAPDGQVYVIEANPNPDLSEGDAYLLCAAVGGLSFSDVIGKIVGFALQRRDR